MQGTLRRRLPLAALLCLAAPAAAHAKQAGDYASTTMVGAMNAAATQDLRSVDVTPVLAQLLSTDAPSARDAKMVELLKQWHDRGSSRFRVPICTRCLHAMCIVGV